MTDQFAELKEQLAALEKNTKERRLVENFSGVLLYGKFKNKKETKASLAKAKMIIKERLYQEPRAELYFKATPKQSVMFLDPESQEWIIIYMGAYNADSD